MKAMARIAVLMLSAASLAAESAAYPIDGYALTGIRRLAYLQQVADGRAAGPRPAPGGLRPLETIGLNLTGDRGEALAPLPRQDAELQRRVDALFPDRHESYGLVVLDVTAGRPPRLASRRADQPLSPGSVGKLAIAAGLFAELAAIHPDRPERRREVLRTRRIRAEDWIHTDHHNVPIYDPETGAFESRPIREGDVFSLYEWTDHMLSASANAAASTVWKELLLMRRFGPSYPPSAEQEQLFFSATPPATLRDMAMSTVNDPLRRAGIASQDWQLASFFTASGKRRVPPGGKSVATPRGLMQFLVAMERGILVDPWSSLDLKRLLFMSARRIRYASAPSLSKASVYFKSGSLFRCVPEPDFACAKYKGNAENVMNSVIVVEHPDGRTYLVSLMSNVLRKNSAVDHQQIAHQIDALIPPVDPAER